MMAELITFTIKIVKSCKLKWFGPVSRQTGTLAKDILQGSVDGVKKEKLL